MGPQRVPNRAPEATRAENGETLIFDYGTKDFNDLSCLRPPSWRQTCVQNGFQIAASTLKALRKPLEGSWSTLGALLETSSATWEALGGSQEAIWAMLEADMAKKCLNNTEKMIGPAECVDPLLAIAR